MRYKVGDYNGALTYLTEVVEKSPDVNIFNYHLGMTYKMLGDSKNATIYLQKSLHDKEMFKGRSKAEAALNEL